MDCPNGFIVTVNGGTYPFTVTVQGLSGSCQTSSQSSPCCFSMQGYSAGTYYVIADNGSCRGSEKADWPGSGTIPVTVDAYDCYK